MVICLLLSESGTFKAVETRFSDLRDLSGRGTARAEDARGTPAQGHKSPSILVYAIICLLLSESGTCKAVDSNIEHLPWSFFVN